MYVNINFTYEVPKLLLQSHVLKNVDHNKVYRLDIFFVFRLLVFLSLLIAVHSLSGTTLQRDLTL